MATIVKLYPRGERVPAKHPTDRQLAPALLRPVSGTVVIGGAAVLGVSTSMKTKSRSVALLVFAIAVCVTGCKRSSGNETMNFKHNKDGKGTPVATFDDDSITVEELNKRFAEMSPFIRARYQTPEQRKEYVENVARVELLVEEARRRGLQNEPEVVDAAKKMMVQKLIQKLDENKAPISDAEIAEYYEKHKAEYVKPETTRLSDIFIGGPKDDPSRPAKKKAAEELLGKAKANKPTDSAAFIALVRQYSEDPKTKPLDGDMRFLTEAELSSQYGPEVASAAAGLKQLGDLSPLVETQQGFYILRFQGRQAAVNHSLDQVKTQIQSRIGFDRRQQNFNKLVDSLKVQFNYKLDEANLAKVQVDTTPPSSGRGPVSGPPPPGIPAPPPAPASGSTGPANPPGQAKSPSGH